jgi:hypothetical protein
LVKLTSFTNEVKVQGKAQGTKRKGITEMNEVLDARVGPQAKFNVMLLYAGFALWGFRQHKN